MTLAFHNDPKLKAKYLARVRDHRKADRLIQGTGWEYGRGCAVGCTLEAYDHNRYPIELGIPVELARLEDGIFEGLARSDAMDWPEAFLDAIPVGADLSLVWPRFAHWLLVDDEHGVIQYAGSHEGARTAIQGVADLFARRIAGNDPTTEEWAAARAALGDAACAAEWAALGDAACAAARAAEWAAEWAVARAARAARAAAGAAAGDVARAAAGDAARAARAAARAATGFATGFAPRSDAFKAQSTRLLQLLREAPVPQKNQND